jgi:hypothetical protein
MRQQMLGSVLAKTTPGERHLYDIARCWLAELERAAPWERLYEWPGQPEELAVMAVELAATIDRLTAELQWPADAASVGRELSALESAVARLHLVHSILSQDLERLRRHSARCQAAPEDAEEALRLQELIAEVKGKNCDAMIGATVALIAADQSDHLLIEHLLFPERGEEARSARAFLKSLREIRQLLEGLAQTQPFAGWIAGWREEKRIDRYALVPLTQLRGALGAVLHQDTQRALHVPDFHQLCRREVLLSDAVADLERLHRATWSELSVPAETYAALVWRTLELAAILDVENLLKDLIGSDLVDKLRGMKRPDPSLVHAEPLRHLVRQDDLRIVLDLVRSSMRKRGSLQLRPPTAPRLVDSAPRAVEELVEALG